MTIDDLSALLPDPPPSRPARREAAIEDALRRFDAGDRPVSPAPVAPRPARRFEGWGRPQIAALASVALVVLVSVPIWWSRDQLVPDAAPTAAQQSPAASPVPAAAQASRPTGATGPAPTRAAGPEAPAPAAPIATAAASAGFSEPAVSADVSPAPEANLDRPPGYAPPPPPADPRARGLARGQTAAKSAAAPPPPPPPPPPPAAVRRDSADAEADRQIVVTGSRVARPNYESNSPAVSVDESFLQSSSTAARADGDWNACTLLDPRRDASACRAFVDPSAPGDTGRAAAQLADGLTLAWQGNLDRAIDMFDRAIRAAPDLSIAYLNRGLAWQEKGDLGRALGDLNRAVARDPGNARAYYHRSQLHRARGDTARAEADARKAAELAAR